MDVVLLSNFQLPLIFFLWLFLAVVTYWSCSDGRSVQGYHSLFNRFDLIAKLQGEDFKWHNSVNEERLFENHFAMCYAAYMKCYCVLSKQHGIFASLLQNGSCRHVGACTACKDGTRIPKRETKKHGASEHRCPLKASWEKHWEWSDLMWTHIQNMPRPHQIKPPARTLHELCN